MSKSENKVGRPTVMTPKVIEKLEEAFSLGCGDLEACLHAGICKQALYDYQKKYPEFTDRKAMLKEKLVLKARTVVADALSKNDKALAWEYLQKKRKDEFGTRTELTGANGAPIATTEVSQEEAREVADSLDDEL